MERRPSRRLGMLNGRAQDIKHHAWFDNFDWEALEARRMTPPRQPKDDSKKRITELTENEIKLNHQNPRHLHESAEDLKECQRVFADF